MGRGLTLLVLADEAPGGLARLDQLVARARRLHGVDELGLAVLRETRLALLSPYFDASLAGFLPALSGPGGLGEWHNPLRAAARRVPEAGDRLVDLGSAAAWLVLPADQIAPLASHLVAGPGVDPGMLAKAAGVNCVVTPLPQAQSEAPIRLAYGEAPRPWRLLLVNVTRPSLHHKIGALVEHLLAAGHSVEMATFGAAQASAPTFLEDERVVPLDPNLIKIGTFDWDMVVLGAEIPPFARRFRTLQAQMTLCERSCNLSGVEVGVALTVEHDGIRLDHSEDPEAYWLEPPTGETRSVVVNGRLSGRAPPPAVRGFTLAESLRLHGALIAARSPMATLALAAQVHAETGLVIGPEDFQRSTFCRLMGAGMTPDSLLPLAVCGMAISAFSAPSPREFCHRVYDMLLARRCEESFYAALQGPLPVEKMVDILHATARSAEFARRSTPQERAIIVGALADLKGFLLARHDKLDSNAPLTGIAPLESVLIGLTRDALARRRHALEADAAAS